MELDDDLDPANPDDLAPAMAELRASITEMADGFDQSTRAFHARAQLLDKGIITPDQARDILGTDQGENMAALCRRFSIAAHNYGDAVATFRKALIRAGGRQ